MFTNSISDLTHFCKNMTLAFLIPNQGYILLFLGVIIMTDERLDFVIFGATGYTGKYAVKVAAQLAKEKQMKFGVSGRRKQALQAVVKEFASDIGNIRSLGSCIILLILIL